MQSKDSKPHTEPSTLQTILARRGKNVMQRRYQKGSIAFEKDETRPSLDRWRLRWREDYIKPNGETGRRQRQDFRLKSDFPTKRAIEREMARILEEINSVDYKPVRQETFKTFSDRWVQTVMVHHKPSNQQTETSHISHHLNPTFGPFPMREITAEIVQTWVSSLTDLSPKYIRGLVGTLQSMWTTAKQWQYVTHNPFEGLKKPKVDKRRVSVYHFSLDEAVAIIHEAKGWYKTFFNLWFISGLRPGEVAGLRVEDLSDYGIQVYQSVWRGSIQTPKGEGARRPIPLPPPLVDELRAHIDANHNRHGLIFTNQYGEPIKMDHFIDGVLDPILDRLGIRAKAKAKGLRLGGYGFRHGNATVMDEMNVPMATRQQRLGHAPGSKVTMGNYTHAVDKNSVAVTMQLWAMLNPEIGGQVQ